MQNLRCISCDTRPAMRRHSGLGPSSGACYPFQNIVEFGTQCLSVRDTVFGTQLCLSVRACVRIMAHCVRLCSDFVFGTLCSDCVRVFGLCSGVRAVFESCVQLCSDLCSEIVFDCVRNMSIIAVFETVLSSGRACVRSCVRDLSCLGR